MMEILTCVDRLRNKNNKITKYILETVHGNRISVTPDALKRGIKIDQLVVTNITLTSDDRILLIEKDKYIIDDILRIDNEIHKLLNKSKILGLDIDIINTWCGNKIYVVSKSKTEHLILIPSDVKIIVEPESSSWKDHDLWTLPGTVRVIGGKGLIDISQLFRYFSVDILDLTNFSIDNVRCMESTFFGCRAHTILGLEKLNTSNIRVLHNTFYDCETREIDISNWDLSNARTMKTMFSDCKANVIRLGTMNINSNCDTTAIFFHSTAKIIGGLIHGGNKVW